MPSSLTTTQNSLPGVASLSGWDSSVPTEFHWAISALRPPPPLSLPWRDVANFVEGLCRHLPKTRHFDKVYRQSLERPSFGTSHSLAAASAAKPSGHWLLLCSRSQASSGA